MNKVQTRLTLDDREITLESGNWAKQADGAVVYRSGKLVLLATVCAEKEAREGQDFFPLTVHYQEKSYAVGRFPGGYFKRENRPAEHETLISRLIDRPIRPLFPEGYFAEVQLLVTVLSSDPEISIEGHAVTAASAALMASDIPFHGPIAGVLVGKVDGTFIADPSSAQMKASSLELVVAGSADAITMIEGGAQEYTPEEVLEALEFAHQEIKKRLAFQMELAKSIGQPKREVKLRLPDKAILEEIDAFALKKVEEASNVRDKQERSARVDAAGKEVVEHFSRVWANREDLDALLRVLKNHLHDIESRVVRDQIFNKGIRADGRKLDEIRAVSVELDVLPGVHGSAVFTRGQTQSLGVVTLGTGDDYQRYENLEGQQVKHFMLHYNFPSFSVGEVKRVGPPGRREIGHGNLAERALRYVVPPQNEFPYVIRVVSEILESNGSSSMASVCSGSLAMMVAGVPLKDAVSGIAMGLITEAGSDRFAILSDIAGLEDHFGDMDFKLAGTARGITAFQLDIKVTGISLAVMKKAILQAEAGRQHILKIMNESITVAREISPRAPRIVTMQIDSGRIGELIGPGGKIIRSIIEKTGANISVEDSGVVTIASPDGDSNEKARRMIELIFAEVEIGQIYSGIVKKIADFGAFIELSPGKEGLLHISKMDLHRVNSPRDLFTEGDTVEVMVIGVDRQGRIDLSRKELLQKAAGLPVDAPEAREPRDSRRDDGRRAPNNRRPARRS